MERLSPELGFIYMEVNGGPIFLHTDGLIDISICSALPRNPFRWVNAGMRLNM